MRPPFDQIVKLSHGSDMTLPRAGLRLLLSVANHQAAEASPMIMLATGPVERHIKDRFLGRGVEDERSTCLFLSPHRLTLFALQSKPLRTTPSSSEEKNPPRIHPP